MHFPKEKILIKKVSEEKSQSENNPSNAANVDRTEHETKNKKMYVKVCETNNTRIFTAKLLQFVIEPQTEEMRL